MVSPSDIQWRVVDKAFVYLDAGTRLVWVLDPRSKTVTVYRSESDIMLLTREDTLTGEDVVPGFTCPVSQFFEQLSPDHSYVTKTSAPLNVVEVKNETHDTN